MLPLDNAVWTALTTKQSQHAQSSALARRFPPEMTLLGALAANTAMAFESLTQLVQRDPVTLYFTSSPQIPTGWEILRAVELHQMVQEADAPAAMPPHETTPNEAAPDKSAPEVIELTPADVPEMSALYAATRPGRTLCPRIQKLGRAIARSRRWRRFPTAKAAATRRPLCARWWNAYGHAATGHF